MAKDVKFPGLLAELARRGMNYEDFGKAIGHTRETINRKLTGAYQWTLEDIEKSCEFFGKDYYELFK